MLRRKLTRIELKLEDLEEWNTKKKEKEQSKKNENAKRNPDQSDTPMFETPETGKSKKDTIHERIGYDPKSKATTAAATSETQ